jgi:hypothetical protein
LWLLVKRSLLISSENFRKSRGLPSSKSLASFAKSYTLVFSSPACQASMADFTVRLLIDSVIGRALFSDEAAVRADRLTMTAISS